MGQYSMYDDCYFMPKINEFDEKNCKPISKQNISNTSSLKVNNILVIGNGFDLYHGLKTKYIDFVDYTRYLTKPSGTRKIRRIIYNNLFINWFKNVADVNHGWIDCEIEIEKIVKLFRKIIYDKDVFSLHSDKYYILRDRTSLLYFEYDMIGEFKEFVCADEEINGYEFNKNYFAKYQGIIKEKVLSKLRSELEDLVTVFRFYLQTEVLTKKYNKLSKQILNIKPDYVISFNYTNTYKKYGIADSDVCFIHGSVEKNNMVLGIKDIDEKDIDFIHFKKYFQRIQKRSDIINTGKMPYFSNKVYFFGHSLSDTDGDIIRSICKGSNKIIIYYVKQKNNKDYEQKVINIIDVLGKENAISKIQKGEIQFIRIK